MFTLDGCSISILLFVYDWIDDLCIHVSSPTKYRTTTTSANCRYDVSIASTHNTDIKDTVTTVCDTVHLSMVRKKS